jgi:hypothetical protein
VNRPEAPDELTDEQAEEWRAITGRMPADWFPRETHGMLTQLCRHTVAARRVAQLIGVAESSEHLNVDEYERLLSMQDRESRAVAMLATKMRISQQTTYDPRKRKPVIGSPPWEPKT